VRGLPISRGKLYPGYRLFRRLRFVVGGNRRERSSNERVARPLDAPLVFARRRFIEILFLWPARARASARRGAARRGAARTSRLVRGERWASGRPAQRRRERALFFSFPPPFFTPSRTRAYRSIFLYPTHLISRSRIAVFHVLSPTLYPRFSTLASLGCARAHACSLSHRNLARPRSRFLAAARLIYALRPFNSIATPFYNAAAPVQRKRKSRWLLTLRLTRQRAISRDPTWTAFHPICDDHWGCV